MTDSARGSPDYAPEEETSPAPVNARDGLTGFLGFSRSLSRLSFRPRLWPTLAAALLAPLFLAAGQWQWNKAASKAALQAQIETLGTDPAIAVPGTAVDAQALRFHRIAARGHYEPQFQILIDNRTYKGQAGYHVITPLHLIGSEMRILVNRGWLPVQADRRQMPNIDTPPGMVEAEGMAIIPSRFFTLADSTAPSHGDWQSLWQNLDLDRYGAAVDFPVQPVILQLDAQSEAGGFARDWPRPDDRRQVNLGYALQWWSFAATTVVLWLVLNLRRGRRTTVQAERNKRNGVNHQP